jgi:hypothetical protein
MHLYLSFARIDEPYALMMTAYSRRTGGSAR